MSQLIVMLTHNDRTVKNAMDIFEECKTLPVEYWGFKEAGIPINEMKELVLKMKSHGKTTFLEVVAYTEKECIEGAKIAEECGFDILMGTMYFDSIMNFTNKNNIKYLPFVGKITGRPSILNGTIDNMVIEATTLIKKGVYGIDLLGYRFTGNPQELNRRFVKEVNCPICIAGSISSYQRLDEVMAANPWAFTIGGAFFEMKFGETFPVQIQNVLNYIK